MCPNKIGIHVQKNYLFTVLGLILDMAGKDGHCNVKRELVSFELTSYALNIKTSPLQVCA